MHRRELLMGAGSLLAAGAVWSAVHKLPLSASLPGETAATRAFVERLCDIIIPDSDTPGARRAGVPSFVFVALAHGLADAGPADLGLLLEAVRTSAARDPHGLSLPQLQSAIAQIDAAAYQSRDSYWARLKKVIILGYYTSQIGAAQELQYAPVPGRFEPDLPATPQSRAVSNDWVGQQF
jgi:Gluconate 2-dehydrogenase subunit 3